MAAPADPNKTQLRLGLEAAKQQDYPVAISHLRQVQAGAYYEQAQMALVVALGKLGSQEEAIARCEALFASAKPDTRQWAKTSLAKLKRSASPAVSPAAPPADSPASARGSNSSPPLELLASGQDEAMAGSRDPAPIQRPTLPPKNAPAPQRWQPLPPLATTRWTWAGLFLLSLWGLKLISAANIWPSFILSSSYQFWIVGLLGAIGYGLVWINHRSLSLSLAPLSLRLQEILTILALGWLVPYSIPTAVRLLNSLLIKIPFVNLYFQPPSDLQEVLLFTGIALLIGLPWILTGLLRLYCPWQSLSPEELEAISPGSQPLLRQFFIKRHQVQLPKLLLLDSSIPFITSYGHCPRNARIVLSQGLLDRLSGEAIAALVAGELGQIQSRAFVLLPWLNAFLQLPFGMYAVLVRLGNDCQAKLKQPMDAGWRFLYRSGLVITGGLGAIAYGFFKLWRWPLLWMSRSRLAYGDRHAVDLLGDPNAYSRALLAYAQSLADAVATVEQTPLLLEAFELVLPLGLPDALTASFAPMALAREARFSWDAASPYRRWLGLNNSHVSLGDRLAHIASYASRSKVNPEVELTTKSTQVLNPLLAFKAKNISQRRQALNDSFAAWKPLLYQGFPFYGALLGLAFGLGLWALGATVSLFGGWWFDWVYGDRQLLRGCIPLGVGIGLIIRTNAFFPQRANREKSPEAAAIALLPEPGKLPIAAEPVEFSGKLVGRPGVANWLGQDLLLLGEQGPLRLHWCSPLGPAGNLWPKFLRPSFLLQREVVVSGWLRRGATLWLDVEQIRTVSGGKSSQRGHPMWAAVMAGIAILWGVVILLPSR